jgi:hypothetical protein
MNMSVRESRPLHLLWRGGVALLSWTAAVGHADEAASAAVEQQAAVCRACHQGATSLAGKQVGDVSATLRVIADGVSKHPPVKITLDLDDRNIAALAKALTAAQ